MMIGHCMMTGYVDCNLVYSISADYCVLCSQAGRV